MTLGSDVQSRDCPFCAIARGEDSSVEVVREDTNWVAFFPHEPATPGHTLVTPRAHVVDLWQAEPALGADLMAAVILVGRAIQESFAPDGINLITSAGKTAEQTVFHLHLHVVPRWRQDGFGPIWPPEGKFEDEELAGLAILLREALRR